MNNQVKLSTRDEAFLAKIADPKVRNATRISILAEKQKKEDERAVKREEYKAQRDVLSFEKTENGYLLIKGTGTGRWALFSPKQARAAFVKNIKELQAIVNTLPEQE